MTDPETTRLVAWAAELRRVHARLREVLAVTGQRLVGGEDGGGISRDVQLHCHGFCTALDGHHRGEDGVLFPAIQAARPDLGPVLRSLENDHSMIARLLQDLQVAVDQDVAPDVLTRHLDGVAAIMESHFRYEERELLAVLDELQLDGPVEEALGRLAR